MSSASSTTLALEREPSSGIESRNTSNLAGSARTTGSNGSAVGERIIPAITDEGGDWHTIVGVVANVRQVALDSPPGDQVYTPYTRTGGAAGRLLVRSSAAPAVVEQFLREVVREEAPEQPVANVRTLRSVRDLSLSTPRTTTLLVGLFAALALAITVAGIGGTIAYSVGRRTHELGIRMALGARRAELQRMVVGRGITLSLLGLAAGSLGALGLADALSRFLYETEPTDPTTYALVAATLLLAAALACWLPARRATSIDPMQALRVE